MKVYVVFTEEWYGGYFEGRMKVFQSKPQAEEFSRQLEEEQCLDIVVQEMDIIVQEMDM